MSEGIGGEGEGLACAKAELAEAIEDVRKAAREWGVRPDHLEGKFVGALLQAIGMLGRLVFSASAEVKQIVWGAKKAAEAEVVKLREANRSAELAVAQAHKVQEIIIAELSRDLAKELTKETQKWLILKQWNHNLRFAWYLAGVVTLCGLMLVFFGYGVRAWQYAPVTEAVERCVKAPLVVTSREAPDGEYVCRMVTARPHDTADVLRGLGGWVASWWPFR